MVGLRPRASSLAAAMLLTAGLVSPADAAVGPKGRQGIALAQKGDCVAAIPVLEDAELERHNPQAALELAECYVKVGELVQAADLLRSLADEKVQPTFGLGERQALLKAKKRVAAVEARVPRISFELARPYDGLVIEIHGLTVEEPEKELRLPPDTTLALSAKAPGYQPLELEIILEEGEKRVVNLELEPEVKKPPRKKEERPERDERPERSELWLGAKYRGFLIPQVVMDLVGDGGTTVYAPGGGLALTTDVKPGVDLTFVVAYASYRMQETPFKPNDTPNTEWEIIESDLQALTAGIDLMVDIPIDDSPNFSFRIGGGVGFGVAFAGDLYRTQAYPEGDPDDPQSYRKCAGPNDPAGTFRYCNQLDKDADHYDGFTEPSWFDGGSRPLLYPHLALPQMGLTWYPADSFAIDLEVGLTLSGLLTGLGARFGI